MGSRTIMFPRFSCVVNVYTTKHLVFVNFQACFFYIQTHQDGIDIT